MQTVLLPSIGISTLKLYKNRHPSHKAPEISSAEVLELQKQLVKDQPEGSGKLGNESVGFGVKKKRENKTKIGSPTRGGTSSIPNKKTGKQNRNTKYGKSKQNGESYSWRQKPYPQ